MTARMLKSLFIGAILTCAIHQSRAELQIRIISADFISQSQFRVVAHIFNIGSEVVVQIPYGEAAATFPQDLRTDVYAEYRKPTSQGITKTLPLSITIKTLLGTSISAEYHQRIAPTGTTTYYEWEIVFDIPIQALDISLNILGVTKDVKDSEFAKRYEKEAGKSGNLAMQDGDELFAQGKYKEAIQKYMIAVKNNEQTLPKLASNLTEAFYQLGNTSLSEGDPDEALDDLGIARKYAQDYKLPSAAKIDSKLAVCYAKLGERNAKQMSYGDALWLFRKSLTLDASNSNSQEGFRQIEAMKHSPALAGVLCILPGGGQIYNHSYVKAGLVVAAVGVGALIATSNLNKAADFDAEGNRLYQQFLAVNNGSNPNLAAQLSSQSDAAFRDRDKAKQSAMLGVAVGAVAVGFSIWDAITDASSYNTRFEPTNAVQKYQLSFFPSCKGASVLLAIRL